MFFKFISKRILPLFKNKQKYQIRGILLKKAQENTFVQLLVKKQTDEIVSVFYDNVVIVSVSGVYVNLEPSDNVWIAERFSKKKTFLYCTEKKKLQKNRKKKRERPEENIKKNEKKKKLSEQV